MESSGVVGKIHVSSATADILTKSGKEYWLQKRDEVVHLKGIGSVQTFFLTFANQSSDYGESVQSGNEQGDELVTKSSMKDAMSRLIDWNVSTLFGLLKRVVASRSFRETKQLGSIVEFIHSAGESFLDEVAEIVPVASGKRVYVQDGDAEIPSCVEEQLHHFVSTIAGLYRDNAFHSFQHASHVL